MLMLSIDRNFDVLGFETAVRGMRNSYNSWDKSDSDFRLKYPEVGKKDYNLMKKLASSGSSHAKFRRFINVTLDITAPLYWWKEFDTYKVGTVANSCSTMHTIHTKEFTLDDFSHEHLENYHLVENLDWLELVIRILNENRKNYIATKDKKYWWQIIQLLPESYNQKRTVQLNYEVLSAIYSDRLHHKLDEWREFCKWIESLPYSEGIIFPDKSNKPQSEWDFAKK